MTNAHDAAGRPWARLSEPMPGDKVELDSGFTCHAAGIVEVKEDPDHPTDLYFDCVDEDGEPQKHLLSGQADDGEHLVGIYHAASAAAA
jgi:hypothetical protein